MWRIMFLITKGEDFVNYFLFNPRTSRINYTLWHICYCKKRVINICVDSKWQHFYNWKSLWRSHPSDPNPSMEDLSIILLLNSIHSNSNPYQYQFTHINKEQAPSGSVLTGICLTLQAPSSHADSSPSSTCAHTHSHSSPWLWRQ